LCRFEAGRWLDFHLASPHHKSVRGSNPVCRLTCSSVPPWPRPFATIDFIFERTFPILAGNAFEETRANLSGAGRQQEGGNHRHSPAARVVVGDGLFWHLPRHERAAPAP